jgi:hypothetical protein
MLFFARAILDVEGGVARVYNTGIVGLHHSVFRRGIKYAKDSS